MKSSHAALIAGGTVLLFSATTLAKGPPAGVPMGPPAFVTMGPPPGITKGPPAFVTTGPPAGITKGPPSLSGPAIAANELGKLNAAHASPVALQHAAPNSAVGVVATYQTQMTDALALVDPVERDAAITAAREQLGLASNKQLTPSAVERIDGMLGIAGAPADLGTTP